MSGVRDDDFRQIRARSVHHRHVADAVNERAVRAARELVEHLVAALTVGTAGLHLDELVIVKRTGRLFCDCVGEAGISDEDHRLQGVGEAAKIAALMLRKVLCVQSQ